VKTENQVTLKVDEMFIKRDLGAMIVPGVIYYRDVPIKNFDKDQLIKIIYLMSFSQ